MNPFYTNVSVWGNDILYRGIENGKRVIAPVKGFQPSLFTKSKKSSEYKTYQGESVERHHFDDIKSARNFLKKYRDVEGITIYGNDRFLSQYIVDTFDETIDFDHTKIVTAYLDIECESENGFPLPEVAQEKINAITMGVNGVYYVFGLSPTFDPGDQGGVEYIYCADEVKLIEKFLTLWNKIIPDIVTGWYISSFDIPYIVNRINRLSGEDGAKLLSPWKLSSHRKFSRNEREFDVEEPMGVAVLDYFDLYKKFSRNPNQASYTLDYISSVETGLKKLDYSEHGSLHKMYKEDYNKFLQYNLRDVVLVRALEDKLQIITMAIGLAYDAKVNFIDVFSQVKMWESIIFNIFKREKLVLPPKVDNDGGKNYQGAYVKDPIPGMYDYIASFDLKSLYPHIIAQWNISPETILPEKLETSVADLLVDNSHLDLIKERGVSLAASGYTFRNDVQGFLPKILMKMYEDRDTAKKIMISAEKDLEKIRAEMKRRGIDIQTNKGDINASL
jgi:DNA polymerase elongation subunit (family B)